MNKRTRDAIAAARASQQYADKSARAGRYSVRTSMRQALKELDADKPGIPASATFRQYDAAARPNTTSADERMIADILAAIALGRPIDHYPARERGIALFRADHSAVIEHEAFPHGAAVRIRFTPRGLEHFIPATIEPTTGRTIPAAWYPVPRQFGPAAPTIHPLYNTTRNIGNTAKPSRDNRKHSVIPAPSRERLQHAYHQWRMTGDPAELDILARWVRPVTGYGENLPHEVELEVKLEAERNRKAEKEAREAWRERFAFCLSALWRGPAAIALAAAAASRQFAPVVPVASQPLSFPGRMSRRVPLAQLVPLVVR